MGYTLYFTITQLLAVTSARLLLGKVQAVGGLSQQVPTSAQPPVRFSRPLRPVLRNRFDSPRQACHIR